MTPQDYQRPPWAAAAAAMLALAALALTSGAYISCIGLGLGLLASYLFSVRFENVALTKWPLRIFAVGSAILAYLVLATKDDTAYLDMRYPYSFALAAAAEMTLQFWRREPTGGPRAPFTAFLSAFVFLIGCSATEEAGRYLWLLAPAFFFFFTLALPGFRARASVPLGLVLVPALLALGLGGTAHLGFATYRGALNALGTGALASRRPITGVGMSGQPILGAAFTLRDSLTRVLRVQNLGSDPYLRGMTFDNYEARTWGPPIDSRKYAAYRPPRLPRGDTARYVRLDDGMTLLFTPLHSTAIVPEGAHALQWAVFSAGPLRLASGDTDPLTYSVAAGSGDNPQGLLDAPPTADTRERDLLVPREIDRRVISKAESLGAGLTPQGKIDAVVHFLGTNNRYSLTVNPGKGDPISNFILEKKAAHCEYFASSATVMLRAMGVPTRYVSGYYAHEGDGKGWTLVRQRDAHAWAESWVDGTGWVTVDATPGGGRPDALAGAIPWWYHVWEEMQDALGAIRNWVVTASWLQKGTVFALLVLGLLIPQGYRWWQRRRTAAAEFRYAAADAALTMLARRFERLLRRNRVPCPPGMPWRDHLDHLEAEGLAVASWKDFARNYSRARFGSPSGPDRFPEDVTRLRLALRLLEKQRKKPVKESA